MKKEGHIKKRWRYSWQFEGAGSLPYLYRIETWINAYLRETTSPAVRASHLRSTVEDVATLLRRMQRAEQTAKEWQ